MVLYNFHRVLIAAAILFGIVLSLYCYRNYQIGGDVKQLIILVVSSAITIGLLGYMIHFNKNLIVLRSMVMTYVECDQGGGNNKDAC